MPPVPQEAHEGALEVARLLRDAYPELILAIGGRAAQEAPGVVRLPQELTDSVATVGAAIAP